MKLQDLEYFIQLADSQSFTKTAEHFYVSQPSISIAIKRLESELDTSLFVRDRSSKQLHLTEAGTILYKNAQDVRDILDFTKKEIQSLESEDVQLGIPPIIGGYLLPKLIPHLTEFSESMKLIEEDGSVALFDLVRKKKVTTAIVGTAEQSLDLKGIRQQPILEDEFYICVSSDHPLAQEESIQADQLNGEAFISLGEGYTQHHVFKQWLNDHNIEASAVHLTNEIQTAKSLVSSGVGVSLLIGLLVSEKQDIVKIPLVDAPKFYINLLTNEAVKQTPIQARFTDSLTQAIKETFHS